MRPRFPGPVDGLRLRQQRVLPRAGQRRVDVGVAHVGSLLNVRPSYRASPNVWRQAAGPDRERLPSFPAGLPRSPVPFTQTEPIAAQQRYAWVVNELGYGGLT